MNTNLLSSEGAGPLYRQLMEKLRSDIVSGTYPVHTKIPSEPELCALYQVSRVTVRKALQELTREGLLVRKQGMGTFVGIPRLHRDLTSITSFHEYCKMLGLTPGTKLIHAKHVIPSQETAMSLQIEPNEMVLEIVRLRMADDMPVTVEKNCFARTYDWLLKKDLNGSLYELLREQKVIPGAAMHEISLAYANGNDAKLL